MQIGIYDSLNQQYQDPNSLMCKKLQLVERSLKSGASLLDVGAGTGEFVAMVKNKFELVVALDSRDESVEMLRERFRGIGKVTVLKEDATAIERSVRNQKFDVIAFLDVLEHLSIEGTINALQASERLLKDDGTLIISVPGFFEKVRIGLGRSPDHRHSHSSYGWMRICRRCGFRVKSVETVEFPLVHSDFLRRRVHLLGKCCLIVAEKRS